MGDSRVNQFSPFKKIGADVSTIIANDAVNFQRVKPKINVEALAANRTLLTTDYVIQWLDPNGSDRDVTLPAEANSTDLLFIILNTANGAGEDLVVEDDTPTTIVTLGPGMTGIFSCDGTNWKQENNMGTYYDSVTEITINYGGHVYHRTAVGAADYNPSIATNDYIIAFTNTAAARTCTISTEDIQSGSTDYVRIFVIEDESGGAGANNITINLENGGTINGILNFVINSNYGSKTLYLDGTNGFIV